jgi:hypothetical protein
MNISYERAVGMKMWEMFPLNCDWSWQPRVWADLLHIKCRGKYATTIFRLTALKLTRLLACDIQTETVHTKVRC